MGNNANAAVWFVDRHASVRPDKVAFVEGDGAERSMTYGELGDASGKMAALYERHGLSQEDRVAMLVLDQVEFPVIFWGSMKAGVVPIAINTLLATDVYKAILDDSRARALFVSEALYPTIEPLLAENKHLKSVFVIGGDTPDGCHDFTTELDKGDTRPTLDASADECAFWLYSSGSTGKPKGVRHVHGALKATVDTYADNILKMQEDDVVYSAAKLFFAYGLGNGMTFPMSAGATTYLLAQRPTPASVFMMIEKARPTLFCGVPTLYAALVSQMDGPANGMDRLTRCISAGEALPAEIGSKWAAHTKVDILDGVGSTEMLHIFLSNAQDDVVYGTSGVAVPGYELRLVDENNNDVGAGGIGELLVNGLSSADGYWNQRDKTRSTFEGNWTRTGDKYELLENGRYVYCGRTDDMFKVSGIWLSPFEVEQALIEHDAVLEAAVVAARDDDDLEKPKAFVVLQEGASAEGLQESLKEFVKEKIGKWKYPRWVEIVPDLPKTATGKIQRFKLRG